MLKKSIDVASFTADAGKYRVKAWKVATSTPNR